MSTYKRGDYVKVEFPAAFGVSNHVEVVLRLLDRSEFARDVFPGRGRAVWFGLPYFPPRIMMASGR